MVRTDPPSDPLGVDELIAARRRWDAEMAAARQRWDTQYPTVGSPDVPNHQTPDEPRGGEHRADTHRPDTHRAGEQELAPVDPDELDLTRFDHLVTQTDKLTPADDELPQPPQSPRWIPPQVEP